MLVVDASVLAPALADDGSQGGSARARLLGERLFAPGLIDLEVVSVLRSQLLAGALDLRRAELALADLEDLPVRKVAHRGLLGRCWELRANLTVYDAAYIALAEDMHLVLVTSDVRLSRAPGLRCEVEVLA